MKPPDRIYVTITADTTDFDRALRRAQRHVDRMLRRRRRRSLRQRLVRFIRRVGRA